MARSKASVKLFRTLGILHCSTVGYADVAQRNPPGLTQGAPTEEEVLTHYRRVRDEIRALVEGLPGPGTRPRLNRPPAAQRRPYFRTL